DVGVLRDGARGGGAEDGPPEDTRPARGVLARRARARHGRGDQPIAREGRARGGLPGAGGADVPGRAGETRVLRRPFPGRVPDARGGGPSRRRALRARGGLGVHGRGKAAPPPPGAAALRVRASQPAELQVKLTLHVWRQKDRKAEGRFVTYDAPDVSPDMSFLEMLDVVNERLTAKGEDPIAFSHDC